LWGFSGIIVCRKPVEECALEYDTNLNLLAFIITMTAGMRDHIHPASPSVLNVWQIRRQRPAE